MMKNHKNIKRIFSWLFLFILVLGTTSQVSGISKDESYAGNQLKQLGILKGYPDGSLKLDKPITRVEVATMMVRVLGYEGKSASGQGKDFQDVAESYWGYENIQNAYRLGLIQGYPDDSFGPLNNITQQEVVAIMVNMLGYKDSLEGEWPDNYLNKAKEIGVIPSDDDTLATKVLSRGEMALIVWDTLLVKE